MSELKNGKITKKEKEMERGSKKVVLAMLEERRGSEEKTKVM